MGLLQRVGLVFARKWVGGTTVEEAVKEAHRLNREGEKVIFNYLGEDLTDISKVEKNTGVYISLLEKIGREK
ncbi:MAG: hypothetical protein KGH62_05845, partial [Candidatus Micrarchaeota archaeon]|nr:hypothetical protein [Candidatus Micrarchaeota archaeon]